MYILRIKSWDCSKAFFKIMVNRKLLGSFAASTLMMIIFVCAHPFGTDATGRNRGQLSRRVAKAICTVAKHFATSIKIQPPLNDASKFSNEDDAQPCQRLQWKTCDGGDCQIFELKDCPAPKGSKPQIKTRKRKGKAEKIVGGTEADPHEFPHQVIFYIPLPNDEVGRCGGSILDEETIISAAHCFYGRSPEGMIMTAGEHDISIMEGPEQNRSIKSIVVHEWYAEQVKVNDIALLKLNSPLALTRKVRPLRLANKKFVIPDMATVTGWGLVENGGSFDYETDILLKVEVPIVLWRECKILFQDQKAVKIVSTNICAGVEGLDSCQGDSGGPLAVKDAKGQFNLIGIVSEGVGCGNPGYPGIYTLVPEYIDWINKNI